MESDEEQWFRDIELLYGMVGWREAISPAMTIIWGSHNHKPVTHH